MYWPVAKEIWYENISNFSSDSQQGWTEQAKLNILINIGRGQHEEHFCEVILNGLVVQEKMSFKDLSYLELCQSGSPFVPRSRTISEILVQGITRINSVKLFWIWISGSVGDIVLWHFLSRALVAPISSQVESFVQFCYKPSWGTILWNYFDLDQWFRSRFCLKTFLI